MRTRTLLSTVAGGVAAAVAATMIAAPAASAAAPGDGLVIHKPSKVTIATTGGGSKLRTRLLLAGDLSDVGRVAVELIGPNHKVFVHRTAAYQYTEDGVGVWEADFAPNGRTWKPGDYVIRATEFSASTGAKGLVRTEHFSTVSQAKISIASSVAHFRGSATTVLSGGLKIGGVWAAGQKVAIQVRKNADSAWRTLYNLRTNSRGRFSHEYLLTGPIQFRSVIGTGRYVVGASSDVVFYS